MGVCVCMRTTLRSKVLKTYPEYQTLAFTNYGCKFSTKCSSHSCCASLSSLLIEMLPACDDFRDRYTQALVYGLRILVFRDLNDLLVSSSKEH